MKKGVKRTMTVQQKSAVVKAAKTKQNKANPNFQPPKKLIKIGQPRAYNDEDIDLFNKTIEDYFNTLDQNEPPTINGLAYFLGFADKWTLYQHQERPVFSDSVKTARMLIERHHEQRMSGVAVTGSIFVLKNLAGWKETSEQTVVNKDYKIEI